MTEPGLFVIHLIPGDLSHWLPSDRRVLRLWLPKVGPTSYALLRLFHDQFVELHSVPGAERSTHTMSYEYAGSCVGVSAPSKVRATLERMTDNRLLISEMPHRWALPSLVPPLSPQAYWRLPEQVRDACDWTPDPTPVEMPTRPVDRPEDRSEVRP